jgi:carboxymethylenebutenolidase
MGEDFLADAKWLKSQADCSGELGAVGFCFGGGIVNLLAVRMGLDLAAGVPFYGVQPSPADAAQIKAPINAQYCELDPRITDGYQSVPNEINQLLHRQKAAQGAGRRSRCDASDASTR